MSFFDVQRHLGACRDQDPELFFPLSEADAFAAQIAQAKAVCGSCPIRTACLDQGMREEFGIWGGMTPKERTSARVAAKPKPAPQPAPAAVTPNPETVARRRRRWSRRQAVPEVREYRAAIRQLARAGESLQVAIRAGDRDAIVSLQNRVDAAQRRVDTAREAVQARDEAVRSAGSHQEPAETGAVA